ncbi:phosphate signaling complex protein PhoU [Parvularcula dongshanensis]|uniref:Phosphate-specific transport system accessory protein PhoU n=1 Tax=Parvularcula dongshanensis TaxID=1173995 RepID=A0A840I0V5_9PROT|nr:phosphate signaling complex protein PhoU [Parvularcula dongshanensis]MBB4657874.1 phosphate transport system protein [Parvularcula dongshanensis]
MAFPRLRSPIAQFERIDVALATMGGFVEQQLSDATSAFSRRDVALARSVAARDAETDARERRVEGAVVDLLEARRLPSADLRRAMVAVKIAAEMERIGDLSKNIGKRVGLIVRHDPHALGREASMPVVRMGEIALRQFSGALDALFRGDAASARAVRDGDDRIDDLYNSVFSEILEVMAKEPALVSSFTQLVFVAKNFERIGDHATNIAERVHFAVTGQEIREERPKADVTSLAPLGAG